MSQNDNSRSDWQEWEAFPGQQDSNAANEQAWGLVEGNQTPGNARTNPWMRAQSGDAAAPGPHGPQSPQGPHAPQGPYGGVMPEPGFAMSQAASAQPSGSSGSSSSAMSAIAIGLAVLLVLLIAGGVGYFYFTGNSGSGSNAEGTIESAPSSFEDELASSSPETTVTTTTKKRAEDFTVPASWGHCSGSGAPGDLNLAYAGTNVTSCPFATSVRDALVEHYYATNELNGTIRAYSQSTNRTYDMSCTDNGDYVTCRGGNNAVVHVL